MSTGELYLDASFNTSNQTVSNLVGAGFNDSQVTSDNYTLATVTPTITIDAHVDSQEIDNLVITGNVVGGVDGQIVVLELGNHSYTTQLSDGYWFVEIPFVDASALNDGVNIVSASTSPLVGPSITASSSFSYNSMAIVNITIDQELIAAGEDSTITFAFEESVSDFTSEDINIGSGEISDLVSNDGGVTWTATYTPNIETISLPDFVSIGTGWSWTASGEAAFNGGLEAVTFVLGNIESQGFIRFDGEVHRTISSQSVNIDGGVSALASETFSTRILGLSTNNDSSSAESARYAIRLNSGGLLDIVENGAVVAVLGEDREYSANDTLSIDRHGDTVVYRHNGEVIYVSKLLSSGALYVDVSSPSNGATLQDVMINRYIGSSTTSYTVNTTTPEVTIDAISADDVVFAGEAFEVSGTTTNVEDGQLVTVLLNGESYEAEVAADTWSIAIPLTDAQALTGGSVAVTANVNNGVGTAASEASGSFTYNTSPAVTITVDDALIATGETAVVTITFDQAVVGFDIDSLTVGNGRLDDLQSADGGITWTAIYTPDTGVDIADNLVSLSQDNAPYYFGNGAQLQVSSFIPELDGEGLPTGALAQQDQVDSGVFAVSTGIPLISADLVTDDNTVTAYESVNGFVITGITFGVADGQILSLTLNGQTYQSEVEGGAWQVVVPQADADALSLGTVSYAATVDNLAGVTATLNGSFTNDAVEPLVISIADVVLDSGEDTTVTFTFRDDVEGFDLSDVSASNGTLSNFTAVNDSMYTATFTPDADTTAAHNLIEVGSGWSFVDSSLLTASTSTQVTFAASAGVENEANNLTKTSDQPDAWDSGTFSNEAITGYGSVSTVVSETDTNRMIGLSTSDENTLHSTIDFALHLSANGNLYVYENGVQVSNEGGYSTGDVLSVQRSGAQIRYLKNGSVIHTSEVISTGDLYVDTSLFTNGATLNDITIDNGSTAVSTNYQVLTGTPTIAIDAVAGDNHVDGIESSRDLLLTGTVDHIANGETVSLSLNGESYTALVTDGVWSTVAPAVHLQALAGNTMDLTASYTSSAGVSANAAQSITSDAAAPLSITVDDSNLGSGETATVTFTFDEAVENFDLEDIQSGGGTLGSLSSSDGGITWTATLTPEAGSQISANAISVGDGWTYVSGDPTPSAGAFAVSFVDNFDTTTAAIGNSVVKTGISGWASNGVGTDSGDSATVDSAAFSNQAIRGNGYLSTTLGADNGTKAIGLSYENANDSYLSMDYAVVYSDGALSFYQAGTLQLSVSASAEAGDDLRLHVNNGVISVSVNGTTVHTFIQSANGAPLYADIALNSTGAAFHDVMMNDDAVGVSGNYEVDTALSLTDVSVDGNTIAVTYDATLSAISVPSTSSFEVTVAGGGRQVTETAISGDQLLITFGGDAVTDTDQVEFSYTATGSNKIQDLFGGLAENIENAVVGNDNLNNLEGGVYDDTIVGTDGDDVISGGAGNDYLLGGDGQDTFVFDNLPTGTDTIGDFEMGENGDVLGLSDVLIGYDPDSSDITDFIRAESFSDADDRLALQVDVNGSDDSNGDAFNPTFTVVFDNISISDLDLNTFLAEYVANNTDLGGPTP